MSQSIIWRGAVWLVIAMMWGSVASAASDLKPSRPEGFPSHPGESGKIDDSTKQPGTQNQPNTNVLNPSVSSPDQKNNFEAVTTVAAAAIDAARHSTEESKMFYDGYSQLLVWAATIISALGALGLGGGFLFLRSRAEEIAEKTARSTAIPLLNAKIAEIDSLLREKRAEIDALLDKTTAEMEQIKTNLNDHIKTYDAFNNSMRTFKDEITSDLAAFVTVIPKSLELASWIGQHGRKEVTDPARTDPHATARLVLEACATALSKNPKQNDICAYIYGYHGVAYRTQQLCRSYRLLGQVSQIQ